MSGNGYNRAATDAYKRRASGVVHAYLDDGVLCGSPRTVASVPAHWAKHVTCKRCLRSLARITNP